MKESFILFTEIIDTVRDMTDEDAGVLFKMILSYEAEEQYEPEEGHALAEVAFSFIRRQLDRSDQKYSDAVEKRRSAAHAGARARWAAKDSERMPNDANACERMRTDAIDALNVPVPDPVPVPVNVPESKRESTREKRTRFSPPTRDQVKEYCRERNNSVDPDRFFDYYESNGWKVGRNPMKDWKAAVRSWEPKNKDSPPRARSGTNHIDYLLSIARGEDEQTRNGEADRDDGSLFSAIL